MLLGSYSADLDEIETEIKIFIDMIEDTDQFISAHLDSVRNEIIKMSLFIEVGGLIMGFPDGADLSGPDHTIIEGSLLDQLGRAEQKAVARNQTDDINRSDMDMVTLPSGETYVVWNTGNQGESTPPNPSAGFSGAGIVNGSEQQWLESYFFRC